MRNELFEIDCTEGFPVNKTLHQLLAVYKRLILRNVSVDECFVDNLTDEFTEHVVLYLSWSKLIQISQSISTKLIVDKSDEIYECAKAFRSDANMLMLRMSYTFGINLDNLEGLHELKHNKSDKQRGQLDDDWNYYLHGAECRFENIKTGQIVEVIIITNPEFGYLDNYFFYNYIITTERFKSLAGYLGEYQDVAKSLIILSRMGVLTRNEHIEIKRNIIAL